MILKALTLTLDDRPKTDQAWQHKTTRFSSEV